MPRCDEWSDALQASPRSIIQDLSGILFRTVTHDERERIAPEIRAFLRKRWSAMTDRERAVYEALALLAEGEDR